MNMNFGSLNSEVSAAGSYMRAYNIYDNVKFMGVEGPTTGTAASGNTWKAWNFKFECPEGTYSERIFEPGENGTERRTSSNGKPMPSDHEKNMMFLVQVGSAFNPDGLKKLQAVIGKIQNYDQLMAAFAKCIGTPSTTTSMKIVGRNSSGKVYASLPIYAAINGTTNEPFPIANSLFGSKLGFTQYETNQMNAANNAKPSPAPDSSLDGISSSSKGEDDDNLGLDGLESLGL